HRPPRSPLFPYTTLFRSLMIIATHISIPPIAAFLVPLEITVGKRFVSHPLGAWGIGALIVGTVVGVFGGLFVWTISRRMPQKPRSEEHTSELQSRSDLVC